MKGWKYLLSGGTFSVEKGFQGKSRAAKNTPEGKKYLRRGRLQEENKVQEIVSRGAIISLGSHQKYVKKVHT